ncbi:haloalkane dehalogenase [uncultured Croceitalea sp.]|uniref:haloalkane dehalogenase n=1 Tax=uncultured Croceitalea sp. TaxID=1798908 RepID=UPI003305B79D
MKTVIKSDFPFESKYVKVYGSKVHYIDENRQNDANQTTFVLLHGNPSSNYLWRNIVPELTKQGRVVAPDLIGFGKSDKPEIDYKVLTHERYIEKFINILELDNIVFVLHDWGTALGLAFARKNENRVTGVAFMEGVIKPKKWDFGKARTRLIFRLFRTPFIGQWMIIKNNFFVENILLHMGTKRELSTKEREYYAAPFLSKNSRKPVYVFPNEIPINKKPRDVYEMVKSNHEWLSRTSIPKLLLWVKPGVLIKPWHVIQMQESYPNLHTEYLGISSKGFLKESHYVQEDFPYEIAQSVSKWFRTKDYQARLNVI